MGFMNVLWSLIPSMAYFTVGFDSFISAYQREGNDILMRIARENGQRLILKNYLYHTLGS